MKKSIFTLLFLALLSPIFGQSWTPMAEGLLPLNYVIFSISAVGEDVVWAVASGDYYQAPPPTHKPVILRTSDGGQTWVVQEIEEAAGTISFQIVATDSLTAWITTQDYNGGAGRALLKTTDGGTVWTKKHINVSAGVALNRFPDGQHWLAHNRQTTSRSANDGQNWTNGTVSGYMTDEYQILHSGTNMSTTAGDTLWNGTSAGRIVRFTNYGQNAAFLTTGFGTTSYITSVAFHDHLHGLLYYSGDFGASKIARTTDGGATWANLQKQPGTGGWNITTVPGAPGAYAVALNYNYASGKIAITKDFGESWAVETIGKPLNAITFTSATTGWAGAGKITSLANPVLYKYKGASLVGTDVPKETLRGFSVSPNPAQDFIQFDFEGNDSNEKVSITLNDMAGKLILQREIQDKKLNVSALKPGIYFLKVETKAGWAIRKIIRA